MLQQLRYSDSDLAISDSKPTVRDSNFYASDSGPDLALQILTTLIDHRPQSRTHEESTGITVISAQLPQLHINLRCRRPEDPCKHAVCSPRQRESSCAFLIQSSRSPIQKSKLPLRCSRSALQISTFPIQASRKAIQHSRLSIHEPELALQI